MAFRQGVQWPVLPSSRYRHQKMRVPEWSSASQGLNAHRQRLEYATLVDQQAPIFCSRFLGIAGASRNGIRSSLLESYIDTLHGFVGELRGVFVARLLHRKA